MAKRKRNSVIAQEKLEAKKVDEVPIPLVRSSDEPVIKKVSFYIVVAHDNVCWSWKHAGCIVYLMTIQTLKGKWTNKQRVLVFSARGTTHRDRHLMMDLRDMMPHSKPESKMEKKDPVYVINEVRLAPLKKYLKIYRQIFKIHINVFIDRWNEKLQQSNFLWG
jgi:ribosome biogenesis protein BRX1